jgi:hypothetical protein
VAAVGGVAHDTHLYRRKRGSSKGKKHFFRG